MASGLDDTKCSASFTNSECKRRTSRYWVVRKLGRLVYYMLAMLQVLFPSKRMYMDVKPHDGIFTTRALEP